MPIQLQQNKQTATNQDIIEEFLDKEQYGEDTMFQQFQQMAGTGLNQQQQQPPQQNPGQNDPLQLQFEEQFDQLQQNQQDEEMFSTFLTEDLNKSEYVMFSPSNMNVNMNVNMNNMNGINMNTMNVNQDSMMNDVDFMRATTPNSIELSPGAHKEEEVFTTPNSVQMELNNSNTSNTASKNVDGYSNARNILQQIKFGKTSPTQFLGSIPEEYFDVNEDSLPYKLTVKDLPDFSRVETQIKVNISISPPPPQFLIHLPADTIAKQKLCVASDLSNEVKENILFLDTFVVKADEKTSCNICDRCIRREQKRASRRKSGVSDNLNWGTNTKKRAIIFNCKEIISFPPSSPSITQSTPDSSVNEDAKLMSSNNISNSKDISLSARIVCYCRHHQEPKGFKLMFVLKDHQNNILARHFSSQIMIMDRKKTIDEKSSNSNQNSDLVPRLNNAPISPTSFEDDSSEPHTTDSRVFKRKRSWSYELSDGFNITPSRNPSISNKSQIKLEVDRNPHQIQQHQQQFHHQQQQQLQSNVPSIQRVIPAQGPLRGGIEVTILGTNFKNGLTVNFGINKALATHCWSDSTIVTYLPPSQQPGQVVVKFDDPENPDNNNSANSIDGLNTAIFTYTDDSDRQLIELALQIVGLKMNGKLEDARNIARKIIVNDKQENNQSEIPTASGTTLNSNLNVLNAHSDEELVLKVINLMPKNPNWALCTQEGQTLLHLACLKGYYKIVSSLIKHGARVDLKDINGFTPLHFASLAGDRNSIELLINCKASLTSKADNGLMPEDVADSNVLDLFKAASEANAANSNRISRRFSNSSISSSIFSFDSSSVNEFESTFASGTHISRMTTDQLGDSEFYDESDSVDDYDYAYISDADDEDDQSDEAETEADLLGLDAQAPAITPAAENSLWNKVCNVFNTDELPKYEDLFPNAQFKLPKLLGSSAQPAATATGTPGANTSTTESETETNSSDDGEDLFVKFFNQRKNVQNDKMLFFFWMPLLVLMLSLLVLNRYGWSIDSNEKLQEFIRNGLGKIMLGNERVKIALNKRFTEMNQSVNSVISPTA